MSFPINPPNAPLVGNNGRVTPEWWRFFLNIQRMLGTATSPFDDSMLMASAAPPKPGDGGEQVFGFSPPTATLAQGDSDLAFFTPYPPLYQPPARRARSVSASTSLTISDDVVLVNAAVAGVSLTLPALAAAFGQTLTIKKIDSSANIVTVTPSGAETIDGTTPITFNTPYLSLTLYADATGWFIL
jgi:hypothetical protein